MAMTSPIASPAVSPIKREVLVDSYEDGYAVKRNNDTIAVELLYPPSDNEPDNGHPRYVTVDMERTHATDGLRIWYSVNRNGWVIEQAQIFEFDAKDQVCDPQWKEVSFINSWACERKEG